MRTRIGQTGLLAAVVFAVAACGDASTTGSKLDLPPRGAATDDGDKTAEPAAASDEPSTTETSNEEELTGLPEAMTDVDKDGIADEKDCDAANPAIGLRVVDDALANDNALFAAATGFPTASWSYADAAYRQTRLTDAGDATFFMGDQAIGDVDLEVRAASTDVTTISPRLRQMFILVGAKMENGTFSAWGCGAEVVQGMSPEQRTSIVKLSGAPGAITTTAIQRTARTILKEGEDYAIKAHVEGGKITCTVMQGTDLATLTTAEATGQGEIKGALGFYTRQTKAYFKNVKACKVQSVVAAPN